MTWGETPPPWGTRALPTGSVASGEAIRAKREALGITQRGLARRLGISRGVWAAIELGQRPGVEHRRTAWALLVRIEAGDDPGEAPQDAAQLARLSERRRERLRTTVHRLRAELGLDPRGVSWE